VKARNAVGFSLDSSEIIVRAAKIPDVPTSVTKNVVDGNNSILGLLVQMGSHQLQGN